MIDQPSAASNSPLSGPQRRREDGSHGDPPKLIVITGLSGAGKALAQHHFEDFGFFCVDNLPPALLPTFAELCSRGDIGRAAIVADVRGGQFFGDLNQSLDQLDNNGIGYQILFLDADDDQLVQRFKETRRRHPLSDDYPDLSAAISAEREALAGLRERADKIVNTSHVTPRQLRAAIESTFLDGDESSGMLVQIHSFGFKHGLPTDADLIFDVRFLPNPNYDRAIGHLDGHCQPVIDYVMSDKVTQAFLKHWGDFIDFCMPHYEKEGKAYLSIGIGCTGGRHRSVVLANWLENRLQAGGYRVSVNHRDLHRSSKEAEGKLAALGGASPPAPLRSPSHSTPPVAATATATKAAAKIASPGGKK
jgi:UPF0042 nucleotide-binding protein